MPEQLAALSQQLKDARRQYRAQMYKHLLRKQGIDLFFLKLPKIDSMLDPVVESLMKIFDEFHSQTSKMDGLRGMSENIKQGWRRGPRHSRVSAGEAGRGVGRWPTYQQIQIGAGSETLPPVQAYLKGRPRGELRKTLMHSLNMKVPYNTLEYLEESVLVYAGHTL